ncbi:MAG: thioredoxin [Candidatus Heimdallarchaeota archaeon]|nr:thioredoxin [Candidatus Heimdallarchaeota archaeon]
MERQKMDEDPELTKIKERMMKKMVQTKDANGQITNLSSEEIEQFINRNRYAVIDFYASWCPPCKIMEPITKEVAQTFTGEVAFAKVNTDEERTAAMRYQIRYVPTFFLFKEGKAVTSFSGAKKKKDFVELIKKHFKENGN